jgi:hypothetical protein
MEKICDYCGEEKGQVTILNPNTDSDDFWIVCRTCQKIIEEQKTLSLGMFLQDFEKKNKLSTGIPEKMVEQSSKRIKELAYESGKEVLSVTIEKK